MEGSLTDDSIIQIEWSPLENPETGLDTTTSYQVYWDYGSNGADWVILVT